jgi:hypothetical protein
MEVPLAAQDMATDSGVSKQLMKHTGKFGIV